MVNETHQIDPTVELDTGGTKYSIVLGTEPYGKNVPSVLPTPPAAGLETRKQKGTACTPQSDLIHRDTQKCSYSTISQAKTKFNQKSTRGQLTGPVSRVSVCFGVLGE